jgi:bacillithiol biosynthesis cysteine-adding enzyme BshC
VKAQCLPFRQIPHTTQLFIDFLSSTPALRRFYPRSPRFSEWSKDESAAMSYDPVRRQRVAAILERQNRAWGASPATLENITRFRGGASAVVTGQQVGLFGGPMFSLFKALSTVKLAAEVSNAGCAAVPVFWLATTDHDLDEINHATLLGNDGSLENLTTPTRGVPDAPVGSLTFGPEIEPVVEAAAALLGESDAAHLLRDCYRPGENFGSAFARLFSRLFAEWGVVLLDASDPELHRIAQPIYRAAIERATELDDLLLERGRELEAAGYHPQVKVRPASTLLFTLRDRTRVPVHRGPDGGVAEAGFLLGEQKIALAEMLRRVEQAPADFSANVLLRPVVEDYLLPTLAYVGGAAEIAYFAQAAVVYQALLGRVTPIVPRFSATIIEAKPQALLERYGLSCIDTFSGPAELREKLAKRALPADLQSAFDEADSALKKSLSSLQRSLQRLDRTLVEAGAKAGSKMQHQLDQLRLRAARAELRQSEVLRRHAELLSTVLYPNRILQERGLAGIYFAARRGADLLRNLYQTMNTDCLEHQIVSL